jgi:hypothetical protein
MVNRPSNTSEILFDVDGSPILAAQWGLYRLNELKQVGFLVGGSF